MNLYNRYFDIIDNLDFLGYLEWFYVCYKNKDIDNINNGNKNII